MQRRDDFIVRLCGGCGQLTEQCECRWTNVMPKKLPTLTPKQKFVLGLIYGGQLSGVSPTVRSLARMLGLNSTNGVHQFIKTLAQKGYVERPTNKARAIIVLALPE